MPQRSRKDRKVQRERAQRASDRGLPAAPPEAYKPARTALTPRTASEPRAEPNGTPASSARAKGWLSQWPLSMKVLGLATLLLLGIGLWRTLSSQVGP